MKITTRIVSGFVLFVAVLAGLVIYQVITIYRMQAISKALSEINFQNALTCLKASSDLEYVEEFTRKSFGSADPQYAQQLEEYQNAFRSGLDELGTRFTSGEEQTELKRLSQQWDAYTVDLTLLRQDVQQKSSILPPNLQIDLENLKTQTSSVYQASLRSMSSKVERSRKTADTAVLVLWCATIAAFAISILVSWLIVRSISKPLAHLTEGTRAIADGKFFYRLDTTRNDEFSQLARDFNKMTLRLNELDELKKGFVSHVSHELKAPLASMHETVQIMLEQIPGPLNEKQKRLLELNLQSGTRLTSMISNLLDLSRTEAGVMEYEMKSQDLIPLVRNAVAELEVQAQERQIQINTDVPATPLLVECDADRVVQVVLNIVGNAVKFSPKRAEVLVRIEKVARMPEGVPERWSRLITSTGRNEYFGLIMVADSGPGIPDFDRDRIFEKFQQVKQMKKGAGQGVGLGLSISRTIVQAHRGAIWVEDNPGGGSRFMVLLRSGEAGKEVTSGASAPL
jgi:signal transduction histidine kinase